MKPKKSTVNSKTVSSTMNLKSSTKYHPINKKANNNSNGAESISSSTASQVLLSSQASRSSSNSTTQNNLAKSSNNAHICAGCNRPINKDKFLLRACDKYWHENCLRCDRCQGRLGELGSTLYFKSNMNLCRQDYLKLFGETGVCSVCDKVVCASEMVMRARQNIYHLECFACQLCNQRFCVGDRFFLWENKVVCQFDYEEHILPLQMSLQLEQQQQQQQQQSSTEPNTLLISISSTSSLSPSSATGLNYPLPMEPTIQLSCHIKQQQQQHDSEAQTASQYVQDLNQSAPTTQQLQQLQLQQHSSISDSKTCSSSIRTNKETCVNEPTKTMEPLKLSSLSVTTKTGKLEIVPKVEELIESKNLQDLTDSLRKSNDEKKDSDENRKKIEDEACSSSRVVS